MHTPTSLTASLCSDVAELTDRKPCLLSSAGPCVQEMQPVENGIADRVTVWCGGCGGYVAEFPLPELVVIEGGDWSNVLLPLAPMHRGFWGEA